MIYFQNYFPDFTIYIIFYADSYGAIHFYDLWHILFHISYIFHSCSLFVVLCSYIYIHVKSFTISKNYEHIFACHKSFTNGFTKGCAKGFTKGLAKGFDYDHRRWSMVAKDGAAASHAHATIDGCRIPSRCAAQRIVRRVTAIHIMQ